MSVTAEVLSAAKWTLGLVVFGIVVSFLLGVVLGVVAALRRSSVVGDGLSIVGSLLHGVPQYVMALILVTLLTVRWHLFETGPVNGLLEPGFNAPYVISLLRHAILPAIVFALSFGFMFGGAIYIENAFNYPGMGVMLLDSITHRDYSEMSGVFLLITAAVIVANILADVLYTVIDPRVRRSGVAA